MYICCIMFMYVICDVRHLCTQTITKSNDNMNTVSILYQYNQNVQS